MLKSIVSEPDDGAVQVMVQTPSPVSECEIAFSSPSASLISCESSQEKVPAPLSVRRNPALVLPSAQARVTESATVITKS